MNIVAKWGIKVSAVISEILIISILHNCPQQS